MIQKLVDTFINNQDKLHQYWLEDNPGSYEALVKDVFQMINENWIDDTKLVKPDYENLVELDHGHYQGTKVFMIPFDHYQPNDYYMTKIFYGSCSHCDTFEGILDEDSNEVRVKDFLTMALHIIQSTKVV